MKTLFEQRLESIRSAGPQLLHGGRIGLEKESLRTDAGGELAMTPHPRAYGSALTNGHITTDFSEALLEFVTPPFGNTWETHQFLCDIHQFAYAGLGDELLWNNSMPCRIGNDDSIPLARYGDSNVGKMKTIYRRGLGYRYGRTMQTISGIHFNYSLPQAFWPAFQDICGDRGDAKAFRSAAYLGLIRNFRRLGWLVLYLFGASPAMCKSFIGDARAALAEFDDETLFEPYATSLRMSDLGYSNRTQSSLRISLNSVEDYVSDLTDAIMTPHPPYERIGVVVDGVWRQLNANLLQIENEFYSNIRPKQIAHSGERPTLALQRGGIAYVEVRSLDINPYDPVGINQQQMRYMEAFLVYCALADSPFVDEDSLGEMNDNHGLVAHSGRDPALMLRRGGREVLLADWAREIHEGIGAVAEVLDAGGGDGAYELAWRALDSAIGDPDETPAARVLGEMRDERQSFFEFGLGLARTHAQYFDSLVPLSEARAAMFAEEAERSREEQRRIEAEDSLSFEDYLRNYFSMS
jgi:glutamate--cysteine ligase